MDEFLTSLARDPEHGDTIADLCAAIAMMFFVIGCGAYLTGFFS